MSDYIKIEDAKKWLTNLREDCGRYQDLWHYAEALDQIIELLDADVAPVRHGKYIGTEFDGYADGCPVYYEWKCSECGCVFEEEEPTYNYCPYCGARMDEEVD